MSEKNNEKTVSIGASELKDLLTTVIQEARKPAPPTEKEERELAMAQEERRRAGQDEIERLANIAMTQKTCIHYRPGPGSRAVFVHDQLGGYMHCQKCQARVRAEIHDDLRKLDTVGTIYDTQLFNRLMQQSQNADIFG